jgi:RHS repeat-associated protein
VANVYQFDTQGRVIEVQTTFDGNTTILVDNVEYMPFGPMRTWTYGNGLVQTTEYNQQYLPERVTVGSLFDVDYGRDAGGVNIDSVTDNVAGGSDWSQTLHYDALNRLKDEDGAFGFRAYEYDENDNRLYIWDEQQAIMQQLTYELDTNRVSTLDQVNVQLDADGNMLDDARNHTYDYDDRGRLVASYYSGNANALNRYDGFGQLSFKIQKPGDPDEYKRTFLYGQSGELLFESIFMSGGARRDLTHVWLNGVPVAFIRTRYYSNGSLMDEILTYVHADHLGTPRIGTQSDSQTISWRWQSDAFGNGDDETDPDNDGTMVTYRLRFAGQFNDGSMGKFYNYFRTYDPSTGRYLESDPVGLQGGLNSYGYVRGNPIRYVDPSGTGPLGTAIGAGIGGFVGGVGGGVVAGALGAGGGTLVAPGLGTITGGVGGVEVGVGVGTVAGAAVGGYIGDKVEDFIDRILHSQSSTAVERGRKEAEDECFDECEHHMCGKDPGPFRLCFNTCMKRKGFNTGLGPTIVPGL